jgi:hypothetical protein
MTQNKILGQKTELARNQDRFWEDTADWRLFIGPYNTEPML